MANQHQLGNWSTEDNNQVHDARSLRYMLGINYADNHASYVSSSPPRRLNGLTLNFIPTSDNGGWTHLSSIRERDNNSFPSSYQTIGGQTGVGPSSPAEGNNISDVISMLPFGGGVNTTTTTTTTTTIATTSRRWWNQPILNEVVDVGGGGVNTNTTTTAAAATTGRRWWNQLILNEVVDVGGGGLNTTITTVAAAATSDRTWWNQPILNDGGGVNTTTTTAATSDRRWWNQPILNEVVDVGGGVVNTTITTAAATTGRRWLSQPILNDGGGVNTTTTTAATTGRRWWNQTILNEVVDIGGGGVNTITTAAATTGRRWWNQSILNEVEDGGPTSFLASTTIPRRPGSFVPPPPPSSPSLSDYLINPHPLQSEQYMQTDSTLASSENPARPGGNNDIFISSSEIRAETDRLMNEIQSTLQHLRNNGSIRSEIMMALEGHIGRVERGLTEEEILRSIHEETYQFNPNETSTQNQTCTICQEDFVDGESIGILDCIHVYHLHCIKQWLELRNVCPICKKRGLEIEEDGN